jgi:hypothetical protein
MTCSSIVTSGLRFCDWRSKVKAEKPSVHAPAQHPPVGVPIGSPILSTKVSKSAIQIESSIKYKWVVDNAWMFNTHSYPLRLLGKMIAHRQNQKLLELPRRSPNCRTNRPP